MSTNSGNWMSANNSNLDFLRATAVLYVVIFHILLQRQQFALAALDLHTLGTWGVLIFFVHTSLVLMFSLQRMPAQYSLARHYGAFIVRRIFRLMPLSVAVVLLIFCLRLPLDYTDKHFHDPTFSASELTSNLLLIQDITHSESIESPLWTLPYEMQMYLCLPFLFLAARATRGFWAVLGIFGMAMLAAGLTTLGVRIPRALPWVPWDLLNYVPCFLAGVLSFSLWRNAHRELPAALWPPFIAVLTVVFLMSGHVGNRWVAPSWMLCLCLGLAVTVFRPLRARWLTVPSEVIARYSYGIYLTHFFCIWFAFVHLAHAPAGDQWAVFIVLAVALPMAFYHALEKPMIGVGTRLANRLLAGRGAPTGATAPA